MKPSKTYLSYIRSRNPSKSEAEIYQIAMRNLQRTEGQTWKITQK